MKTFSSCLFYQQFQDQRSWTPTKNNVAHWRDSTMLVFEILLFLIHIFHKQKPSNTTQFHNQMFQFYQHSLAIYTVFPQQKCNPRHLDKKSLLKRIYFCTGFKEAHPLYFLPSTWNNNKVNRTWRWAELGSIQLQEPKHRTRALFPHRLPNLQLKLLNSCYHELKEKSKLELLTWAQDKDC